MKKKSLRPETEIPNNESREVPVTALPAAFLARMRDLLGDEYEAFAESFAKPRTQGLRLNPLKIGTAAAAETRNGEEKTDTAQKRGTADEADITRRLTGMFGLRKIPWARDGYYYDSRTRPGSHPYHDAGLYYIQEPSAMAVAELMDPRPGERVLDLCAAPGGKTTQIAGRMRDRGLLVSNEIHPARAKILSQNVERFGAANVVVTNEDPERLAEYFPLFFDRILVDAPCSGEGMFRKDEEAVRQWSPENVQLCARRQAQILDSAAKMLRPGGRLVYSTCTFAPDENEGTAARFLDRHPDYVVESVKRCEGLSPGHPEWAGSAREELRDTVRIWPHLAEGEGHFAAVFRRAGGSEGPSETGRQKRPSRPDPRGQESGVTKETVQLWQRFCGGNFTEPVPDLSGEEMRHRMRMFGDQLYLLPEGVESIRGLKILRPGLHLGTVKKDRLEPSHALALYLRPSQAVRTCDLTCDDERLAAYLRGEEIAVCPDDSACGNGWTLVTADGWPAGWAKQVGTALKNHYPKGLRRASLSSAVIE